MPDCPVCKQAIAADAPACDWCAVRLAPGAKGASQVVLPPIRPGDLVASHDFATAPLPGWSEREHTWNDGDSMASSDGGILVTVSNGVRWFTQPVLRMRDVCVRARCDALDKDLRLRVVARKQSVGEASLWYELAIEPQVRKYRLARYFTVPKHGDFTELCPLVGHDAVAGVGHTNELELRVQGPTLEGWINGVQVCSAHDAALGIGSVAIAVGTGSEKQRALLRTFQVAEVAP